jgi:hypothetical protein
LEQPFGSTFSYYHTEDDDALCAKGWIDLEGEIAVMVGYVLCHPQNVVYDITSEIQDMWRNH